MNVRPSSILPPSLVRQRYEQLNRVGASRASRHCTPIRLLSVFRLADFVDKGGLTLIEAVTTLRNEGHVVDLTFAGSGKLPDLPGLTLPPWIKVVSSPSDATLAELYDESDIFVLATRLRARPHPYGEGFGIVLIEASLAGLPVIAPAGGGSHAALLDGITGLRPADDSPDALAAAIRTVFSTRHALGHNGHVWVAERFNPEAFGSAARRVLLDVGMLESPVGTLQLGYSGHGANTHEDPK